MTAIRIVCTFDAVATAETLVRLLTAEAYDVTLSKGRQSLVDLAEARGAREAVILIWSQDAPGAHYMHEWADAIDPARLIEIARAPTWPRSARRGAVIEFAQWRGERGGKAWKALDDRLSQVFAQWAPPKPLSMRAMAGMAGAGAAAALGGVMLMGANAPEIVPKTDPTYDDAARLFTGMPDLQAGGMGGVINAIEPPSIDDPLIDAPRLRASAAVYEPLAARAPDALLVSDAPALREASLMERIVALNPLTREDEGGAD